MDIETCQDCYYKSSWSDDCQWVQTVSDRVPFWLVKRENVTIYPDYDYNCPAWFHKDAVPTTLPALRDQPSMPANSNNSTPKTKFRVLLRISAPLPTNDAIVQFWVDGDRRPGERIGYTAISDWTEAK